MKKEMPWIWEAWSDHPYPLMACTTKHELIRHDEMIKSRSAALASDRAFNSEQRAIQEQLIAGDDAEFRRPRPVPQLDRLHTDWYSLYCQLRREWENIKGLQNRERIWKAVEFVSRRIANPDEDLDLAKQEHVKAFPYQDPNPDGPCRWRRSVYGSCLQIVQRGLSSTLRAMAWRLVSDQKVEHTLEEDDSCRLKENALALCQDDDEWI
jgi:hypothetical protein